MLLLRDPFAGVRWCLREVAAEYDRSLEQTRHEHPEPDAMSRREHEQRGTDEPDARRTDHR